MAIFNAMEVEMYRCDTYLVFFTLRISTVVTTTLSFGFESPRLNIGWYTILVVAVPNYQHNGCPIHLMQVTLVRR